jgi:hypothetical protein
MRLAHDVCNVVGSCRSTKFQNKENNYEFTSDVTRMERTHGYACRSVDFFTRVLAGPKLYSHFNGFAIHGAN